MQSSALAIIENMSDIIGYAHPKVMADGTQKVVLTLRSGDNSVRCGCRFKYITHEIDFNYEALTKALNDAIDKEAMETNGQFVTEERQVPTILKEFDYDMLMSEFQHLVGEIMSKNQSNAQKITMVVEKYLGKNKKVNDTTPEQAEFIYLILNDIKAELM
jgi:hypothetical protein